MGTLGSKYTHMDTWTLRVSLQGFRADSFIRALGGFTGLNDGFAGGFRGFGVSGYGI